MPQTPPPAPSLPAQLQCSIRASASCTQYFARRGALGLPILRRGPALQIEPAPESTGIRAPSYRIRNLAFSPSRPRLPIQNGSSSGSCRGSRSLERPFLSCHGHARSSLSSPLLFPFPSSPIAQELLAACCHSLEVAQLVGICFFRLCLRLSSFFS